MIAWTYLKKTQFKNVFKKSKKMNTLKPFLFISTCILCARVGNGQEIKQSDFGPRISPNGDHVVFYFYRNDN